MIEISFKSHAIPN